MNNIAQRALDTFPGGIANGEYGLNPEQLIMIERGEGCRLWDTSGNEILDFSIGWGSCLVGHACTEVVKAVRAQALDGSNFAYLNPHALAVGEEIRRISPAAEKLRFCASGTEATSYCVRLARAFTGRPKILKFEGAYHGANIEGVTSLFASGHVDMPEPELTSAGTPSATDTLLVAPFNDLEETRRIMAAHRHELAGVIAEPLQRCTPPIEGFLPGLRDLCTEFKVPLIFDEVVTGFRLAYGGAQAYYGVTPDLVAYGKALGGGYPIGAFGGRADLMAQIEEDKIGSAEYVWMASTLGGNPVSMAAARAALGVLAKDGVHEHLHALGRYLRRGISEVLAAHQIEAQVIGDGPLGQMIFTTDEIRDHRSAMTADKERARAVMQGLFARKIFLNPMGTKLYLSIAHDESVIDAFCDRLDDTLGEVKGHTR